MNESQSRDAINGAALVVAAIYFYRKLIEPAVGSGAGAKTGPTAAQPETVKGAAGQLLGYGPLAPTSRFIVGFGFTFLVLSIVQGASPRLAGSFAVLIALGSLLGNGVQVAADLTRQLHLEPQGPQTAGEAAPAPTTRIISFEPGAAAPIMPEGQTKPDRRKRRSNPNFKTRTV